MCPLLGVVPYASHRIGRRGQPVGTAVRRPARRGTVLDLVVIRLAEGLEFYGFQPIGQHPARRNMCGMWTRPECFGEAGHLILLPGTKNVMERSRLDAQQRVGELPSVGMHPKEARCLGICGGYQMLGMTIRDPEHVESGGSMQGMRPSAGRYGLCAGKGAHPRARHGAAGGRCAAGTVRRAVRWI